MTIFFSYISFIFSIFICFAATFGMIGAAVYTGTTSSTVVGSVTYGYGFGAAWGVVGGGYIAGLLNQISAKYLPEDASENGCA